MTTLRQDWIPIKKWWEALPREVDSYFMDLRESVYESIAIEAKRQILTNQIVPSSEMSWKGTPITLVETHEYVDKIGAYGRGRNRYVGLPPNGIHAPSGLTYQHLFFILRFGMTSSVVTIRARPHIDIAADKVIRNKIPTELRRAGFKLKR